MCDFTAFESAYFTQTRQEIDTEKRERDQILNFALLAIGALAVVIARVDTTLEFLRSVEGLVLEASALPVITTLCWIRRKKLEQIADRWYVLLWMIQHRMPEHRVKETLEWRVVQCSAYAPDTTLRRT